MIKFLATKDGRPMLGFGLSRANCEKLLEGKPIFIDLKVMLMESGDFPPLNEATVLIFAGESEASMQGEIESYLGPAPVLRPHYDEN